MAVNFAKLPERGDGNTPQKAVSFVTFRDDNYEA